MAMQETPRSLKLYFGLSGAFGVLIGVRNVAAEAVVPAIVAIVLGGAYLFVAMRLDPLLRENPGLIRMILYISSGILAASVAANLYLQSPTGMGGGILGLLINWYLLVNVKRLSSQARGDSPLPTAR